MISKHDAMNEEGHLSNNSALMVRDRHFFSNIDRLMLQNIAEHYRQQMDHHVEVNSTVIQSFDPTLTNSVDRFYRLISPRHSMLIEANLYE